MGVPDDWPRCSLGITSRHVSSAHAIAESMCRERVPRDSGYQGGSRWGFRGAARPMNKDTEHRDREAVEGVSV
jgi:hypothetical protein